MKELAEWQGVNLAERRTKIERAFNLTEVTSPEDVPISINAPSYPNFGSTTKPKDYFTNPVSMTEWQVRSIEKHLVNIQDDYVPYLMPWYGTGVLASAFGCPISSAEESGTDPAVAAPCIKTVADVAKIKMPEPYRDGQMPLVLETIDYMRVHSDVPVGLTDMQGPLDTLGQMCGQAQLYIWMYEEPKMVLELFDLVTDAFIEWVRVEKKHIGEPLDQGNGLEGIWSPPGIGIWESDDDLTMVGPKLYEEFVVPHLSRIFEAFDGGTIHYCGNGSHQIVNFLKIKGLRAINNSPMGDVKTFRVLRERLGSRIPLQIQDTVPEDVEGYYSRLFSQVRDFRGVMVVPYFVDSIAMTNKGENIILKRDAIKTAQRVVTQVRKCVGEWLAHKENLC